MKRRICARPGCNEVILNRHGSARFCCQPCQHATWLEANPDSYERKKAQARRRRKSDPGYRKTLNQRANQARKLKYATNPEYREAARQYDRQWKNDRYRDDPEKFLSYKRRRAELVAQALAVVKALGIDLSVTA